MEIKANITNLKTAPRKARLVADFIRGKDAKRALAELSFLNKRASEHFVKLVKSAIANAKNNFSHNGENLIIKSITIDEGKVMKRHRAGSRNKVHPIKRRMSHVELVLSDSISEDKDNKKTTKKTVEKEEDIKTDKK